MTSLWEPYQNLFLLIYRKIVKLLSDVGHDDSIIQMILLLILLGSFYQGIIYTYK